MRDLPCGTTQDRIDAELDSDRCAECGDTRELLYDESADQWICRRCDDAERGMNAD